MPQALKASEYQALLDQIGAIYTRAQNESARALNSILTQAYREIGKRIVTVEQKNNIRAQYGAQLLGQISKDLTGKYGKGFSPRNLAYMRQFYLAYPILQAPAKLDWTCYQILSTVKDNQKRRLYEHRTIKEGWSSRELKSRLIADNVPRLRLGNGRKDSVSNPLTLNPKLSLTRGRLYTYRLAEAVTPPAKGNVFVDCGFHVWQPAKRAVNPLPKGAVVETVKSGASFKVVKSARSEKDLYTYKAYLKIVVDADTPWAEIELGLGAVALQKLRLRGIDAPELSTAAGRRAKRFVEKLLKPCPFIIVKTYKDHSDKYDRYLVDIFYSPTEQDPAVVAATGEYLNQKLLDAGLAQAYKG